MLTKTCAKCGRTLEATEENFHVKPNGKYGLHSECKDCRRKRRRNDYKKNTDLLLEGYEQIEDCKYSIQEDGVNFVKRGVKIRLSFTEIKEIMKQIDILY